MFHWFKKIFNDKKFWTLLLIFASAHFLICSFGLSLATIDTNTSPFWPASGFAIGIVYLFGNRYSIAVYVGILAAAIFVAGSSLGTSALMAAGGLLEALFGAAIVRYIFSKKIELEYLSEVIAVIGASLFAPIPSVLVGLLAIILGASSSTTSVRFADILLTWWTGNFIGILTVLPLCLTLANYSWNRLTVRTLVVIRFFALVLVLLATVVAVFKYGLLFGNIFVVFLILLFINIYLGAISLFVSSFTACIFAVYLTVQGVGPFVGGPINDNLLNLQLFLSSLALTALVLDSLKRIRQMGITIVILLISWIGSSFLFYSFHDEEIKKDATRFDRLTNEVQNNIVNRMSAYIDALYGGVSLWAVTDEVTPEKWRAFYEAYKVDTRYPGINGLGVIWPLKSADLNAFVKKQRRWIPDFTVKPVDGNSLTEAQKKFNNDFIITYIEPLKVNKQAQGLDVGTEPHRRFAAEASRDTGAPYMTRSIVLVQDVKHRPGFLLYLPFYKHGAKLDSVEQRRQQHLGWIYAPFIIEEFFTGILKTEKPEIAMTVFEGDQINNDKSVYSSSGTVDDKNLFEKVSVLTLSGVPFTIGWKRTPQFQSSRSIIIGWVILGCSILSLLLSVVIATLQSIGFRAQAIADVKTAELRKSQKELLQANKEALEGVKAKASFMANMSHEIRTPLNGIIGVADLLFETDLTDEQRRYAEIIQNSGNNLLSVINDILDFSRIEAGKLQLEKIPFSVISITEEQADLMIAKARQKGLTLMSYVDPFLPQEFFGDPSRIAQIFSNLISNAIKFTKTGGVRISVFSDRNFKPSAKVMNVRFEVYDTGIGVPEESVHKLFQAFSQIDDSTSRQYGGSGLGLSICKNLVDLMGGQIGVKTEKDQGSTFWFELPLEISLKDKTESSFEKVKEKTSLRVLVMDTDVITRDVLSAYFLSWGINYQMFLSPEEVMRALKDFAGEAASFDLVFLGSISQFDKILDIGKELKGVFYDRLPLLILMAEFENNVSLDFVQKYGFVQILRKPIKQSTLFELLVKQSSRANLEVKSRPKNLDRTESVSVKTPVRKRILVVDDVAVNRQVIVQMLEKLGYAVSSVASGKEALQALELIPFEIVLMDIQMPEMDGFDTTRFIRKSTNTRIRETVVIALTAHALAGDEAQCLAAGMDDYLAKPLKKSILDQKLKSWFQYLDKDEPQTRPKGSRPNPL
ncbi:MAG: CHASE domain-containing protein [Pseudobdellovibrionaceae bacterium]